jgi:NADH-quinone oxidoreductase subunit E
MSRINELISHYPEDKRKSALLPVLHEVQDAHDNWLSVELDKVAEICIFYLLKFTSSYLYHV